MEVTALFTLLLLKFTLLNSYTLKSDAAFSITPNRLQHFQFDTVSFHCEGSDGLSKLRIMKNSKESDPECDIETTTSCTIQRAYPSDNGEYWCENNRVNISVTAGSVILESPVLPVMEGQHVTLSCRSKTTSTNLQADFFKDGRLIMKSSSAETTISNVSKSDEGVYKCSISGVGESPESWLAVREPHSKAPNPPKVLFLLWIAVTVLMLALVLLLMGFLHIRNRRVCEDAADHPDSVTYAVVVTKPREDKGLTLQTQLIIKVQSQTRAQNRRVKKMMKNPHSNLFILL
ncbi:low affinity immunoglobulin gamma Fc region receptor II-a-like [Centropristis striata]|uniref:low affinity immunoglobulin gamma Fc region receptor II-a-like n=1 Tax=Centropristis striata TaxID=184440 RepID=UPI0027E0A611|nr:low affinity immunoglobulin gamma Fc region receptor II-a-like [Centropristis striata]